MIGTSPIKYKLIPNTAIDLNFRKVDTTLCSLMLWH